MDRYFCLPAENKFVYKNIYSNKQLKENSTCEQYGTNKKMLFYHDWNWHSHAIITVEFCTTKLMLIFVFLYRRSCNIYLGANKNTRIKTCLVKLHILRRVVVVFFTNEPLRKQCFMHVWRVSSQISLCSLHRLIWNKTFHFYGIFQFKQVSSKQKLKFRKKVWSWLACADCRGLYWTTCSAHAINSVF